MANNDETEKTYDEKMIIMTILLIMMTKSSQENHEIKNLYTRACNMGETKQWSKRARLMRKSVAKKVLK